MLLGLAVLFFGIMSDRSGSPMGADKDLANQEVSNDDPFDIVFDFYSPWLEAVRSTTTDPYTLGLADNAFLSAGLRDTIKAAQGQVAELPDPVLCQTVPPEKITVRTVFEQENKTQLLVVAKDKAVTAQAVVDLLRLNDGWYIDAIACSLGEFAPEREFTFDTAGYLVKNVPEPRDSNYWHIIFEDAGVMGYIARLNFDETSMCIAANGEEAVCNQDNFTEPTKIHAYGQMSEVGVEVVKIEFLE